MVRKITVDAYEYNELRPFSQKYAREELTARILFRTRRHIRKSIIPTFLKEHFEPNGFRITDEEVLDAFAEGVKSTNALVIRLPRTGHIGYVDINTWAAKQGKTVPEEYEKGHLVAFEGWLEDESFYIAPEMDENALPPIVSDAIRRLNKRDIHPCFVSIMLGLIMMIRDTAQYMLSEEEIVRELQGHYYAVSGRFLCPRQSIIEEHIPIRTLALPASVV